MSSKQRSRHVARLGRELSALARFLEKYGVSRWSSWADHCLALLQSGDPRALEGVRSAFGGMGSLNDVVISQHNGQLLTDSEAAAANQRLARLTSSVYEDVVWLLQDEDSGH
ncbi:hypothetical protein QFZ52_001486 [Arthrobacter woluwensis]|uniref:DUF6966 domain-containing protein n=1 Tax=Arthrobacter woluwensis TaxID=156980 RepID=UPI00278A930C|nr:hypothetical protein [Arthrobacter woluwensis]MDQ0708834.1 hypothetical protein [Arthrobacter woluwensis]